MDELPIELGDEVVARGRRGWLDARDERGMRIIFENGDVLTLPAETVSRGRA